MMQPVQASVRTPVAHPLRPSPQTGITLYQTHCRTRYAVWSVAIPTSSCASLWADQGRCRVLFILCRNHLLVIKSLNTLIVIDKYTYSQAARCLRSLPNVNAPNPREGGQRQQTMKTQLPALMTLRMLVAVHNHNPMHGLQLLFAHLPRLHNAIPYRHRQLKPRQKQCAPSLDSCCR
jgi:hypothetical protein